MSSSKLLNNRYRILAKIGVGGMAVIYKAQDTLLDRMVAIKVLKEEYVNNEQFLKKFKREAQAAARLTHSNIVNVYDVGEEEGLHYIVMEIIEGPTLKEYIEERGCLTWKETLAIVLQIASALDTAHRNNIIHRDIKPQNILMTENGIPKVTDFGIAKAVTSSTVTTDGDAMGSVHYISPEQARGGFVDERSDLYSLGIMMYEMLTGILPYVGETVVSVAIQHIQSNVPKVQEVTPNIPQAVADIANRLTRRNPEERYQNATELMNAIIKAKNNPYVSLEKEEKRNEKVPQPSAKPEEERIVLTNEYDGVEIEVEKEEGKRERGSFFKNLNKKYLAIGIAAVVLIAAVVVILAMGDSKITVPDLTNMTVENAERILARDELVLKVLPEAEYHATIEAGKIISQDIEEGETVKKNTEISVVLSKGQQMVIVPDVTGEFEVNARSKLENAGLIVKESIREYHSERAENIVFRQDPQSDEEVAAGTEVTLYVSKGKELVEVPNITGMTREEAAAKLNEYGLYISEVTEEIPSGGQSYSKGQIMRQTPSSGTMVTKGTSVSVVISLGELVLSPPLTIRLSDYVVGPERDVAVRIEIKSQGNESGASLDSYEGTHKSTDVISSQFKGVGKCVYILYIDREEAARGVLNF